MPFTPAHVAWLYPFRNLRNFRVSWTALFIGSMVPDLEYFIWLSPSAYNSHTLEGIFLFNLPMTFILTFIWHHTLAGVILPRLQFIRSTFRAERYDDFTAWVKKYPMVFLVSALVGICSHLVWDSCSHANGFLAHRIPGLIEESRVGGFTIRNCYIVWYGSTLLGLTVMANWLFSLRKLLSKSSWITFFKGSAFWGKILFAAGLIMIARVAMGLSWNWTRHLVIIAMGSLFYATIFVCYWDKWNSAKKQTAG